MTPNPDAIIIGSGLGGLTCGAFLAKAGMKVCVLEQHTKIGGYAHSFNRNGFNFEIGIHSIPMSNEGTIFHLLNLLGCGNKIEVIEQPEMFRYIFPEGEFVMPSGKEEVIQRLIEGFPAEKANIETLYHKAEQVYHRFVESIQNRYSNELNETISKDFRGISFKRFIEQGITDVSLRNVFYSQWPCVGTPNDIAGSAFSFMLFASHLFEGSYCCKNGFSSLADVLAAVITEMNGDVRTSCNVTALKVDAKKISHVLLDTGEELNARIFISNISPYKIHRSLLPENARSKLYLKRLDNLRPSVSAIAVYLGMKPEFRNIVHGNIINWYSTTDHQRIYQRIQAKGGWEPDHLMFLVKNDPKGKDTLTILYLVDGVSLDLWSKNRDFYAEQIILQAERIYPGLGKYIDTRETASPATFERYTGNTNGALFGFENVSDTYREAKLPIRFHLENLYNTGHWGLSGGGVWNVMVNGHRVSQTILNEKG